MRALIALPLAVLATPAFAHTGAEPAQGLAWTFDPWITAPLALAALLEALGSRRLAARARHGRARLARRRAVFHAGWAVLALALVSPIHAAGERSFFLHMVEHEILMLVAAPLLVLSEPLGPMLWAFPRAARRLGRLFAAIGASSPWAAVAGPLGATAIQGAALWLWHAPALFNRALDSEAWHIAQHGSFLLSALLFWSAMLGGRGARGAEGGRTALAALCLFLTSLLGGALGALMAVSESPWYVAYARRGEALFGLSPAEDQQLAGLVMWVPGGLVHALAALLVVASLLSARERRSHAG